jgi:hypothetical protein
MITMRRHSVVFLLAAALTILLASDYTYAESLDPVDAENMDSFKQLKQIVKTCEQVVKSKSIDSHFSANVKSNGRIEAIGTDLEQFEFGRCLYDNGLGYGRNETNEH